MNRPTLEELGIRDMNGAISESFNIESEDGINMFAIVYDHSKEIVIAKPENISALLISFRLKPFTITIKEILARKTKEIQDMVLWLKNETISEADIDALSIDFIENWSKWAIAKFSDVEDVFVSELIKGDDELFQFKPNSNPDSNPTLDLFIAFEDEIVYAKLPKPELKQVVSNSGQVDFTELTSLDVLQSTETNDQIEIRCLLLVHGTGGDSEMAFGELMKNPFFYQKYGNNIIAFDHSTIRTSAMQNVSDFIEQLNALLVLQAILQTVSDFIEKLKVLPTPQVVSQTLSDFIEKLKVLPTPQFLLQIVSDFIEKLKTLPTPQVLLNVDVITRSRGALVFCEMLRQLTIQDNKSIRMNARKVIMVAPPLKGTPIAELTRDKEKFTAKYVKKVANEYSSDESIQKNIGRKSSALRIIIKLRNKASEMDGLEDMYPIADNEYLKDLHGTIAPHINNNKSSWYSLIADYQGDAPKSMIDEIFGNKRNDYVVSEDSSKGGDNWDISENNFHVITSDKISHMNYFSQNGADDGTQQVIGWLAKEDDSTTA